MSLDSYVFGWEPPNGWSVERPDYMPDCVVLGFTKGGYVTVDFKRRIFGLGYGTPRVFRESMTFTGGKWRLRLLEAAVDCLMATHA